MASISSGFAFPIVFMTKDDALKIATDIAAISPGWCKVRWIYNPDSIAPWKRDYLSIEKTGIWLDDLGIMVKKYIGFVLCNYPQAEANGNARYKLINAKGHYAWNFSIKNGEANVRYLSEPKDCPIWCPECDAELDLDTSTLTEDNCMDFSYTCLNCGHIIKTYEDYGITVKEYCYTKDDIENLI